MNGKSCLRGFAFCWILFVSIATLRGTCSIIVPEEWDRNFINSGGTTESPAVRFELTYLSFRQGHLTGEFHVGNQSGEVVRLDGIENSNGQFWPVVVLEVTSGDNKADWKWRKIGASDVTGKRTTLSVPPQVFSQPFYVNLDAFKSVIGKATYGRVVFTNGEWSMFELSDLGPSKK